MRRQVSAGQEAQVREPVSFGVISSIHLACCANASRQLVGLVLEDSEGMGATPAGYRESRVRHAESMQPVFDT